MGKKGKKEKGRSSEKAAQKLAKKDMKNENMEDLESLIAEFQEMDKKRTTFYEEKCDHPSPRSSLSVVSHPDKDELILFGGEYFNGTKTHVYNDLYVYNTKKNEWVKQMIPNMPPPRCGHQAVAVSKDGGQMWIFGGEFASPTSSQFYHYKDLWVLYLKEHRWEEIRVSGGPSPRSGHRMVIYKNNIFLFGGFHESYKNFMYFNDCYLFSLLDYKWTKLAPSGTGPSPRSACQMCVAPKGIFIIGGYSKIKVKKDVEKGNAHTDMFLLRDDSSKWKWENVKDTGNKPWPRSNFSYVQVSPTRALLFGGVSDEECEEDLESFFHNSLFCVDLVSFRWFSMELRMKTGAKKGKKHPDHESVDVASSSGDAETAAIEIPGTYVLPCGRMNACAMVKRNILYIYGGMFEEGEREVTLNDLWSIDHKKMDEWKQLVAADDTSTDWIEEGDDEGDESSADEDESQSLSAAEEKCEDKPQTSSETVMEDFNRRNSDDVDSHSVHENEAFSVYWTRTKEYWLELACKNLEEDTKANVVRNDAEAAAQKFFDRQTCASGTEDHRSLAGPPI